MRGLKGAQKFHENNTGLPYTAFKIKEGTLPKDMPIVRVLAAAEPNYDENDEPIDDGMNVIQSLFMHQKYKVLNPTRCTSNGPEKDPMNCPLCAVDAPRPLRTFIPVRVRGDENPTRVQIIEYGRDNLAEVQSFIEERPDGDITSCDVKIKRIGKSKDTEYKWVPVPGTDRPLDEDELALEVPDMEELIPIKDIDEIQKRANDYERSVKAKKVQDEEETEEDDDTPKVKAKHPF